MLVNIHFQKYNRYKFLYCLVKSYKPALNANVSSEKLLLY